MASDFGEILKQKREKAGLGQTQCFLGLQVSVNECSILHRFTDVRLSVFFEANEVIHLGQIEGAGTPVW